MSVTDSSLIYCSFVQFFHSLPESEHAIPVYKSRPFFKKKNASHKHL